MHSLPTQRSYSRRARVGSYRDILYRVSRNLALGRSRQISIGPRQLRLDFWTVDRAANAPIEQIQFDATARTLFYRGYIEGRKSIRRQNRSRFLNPVTPATRRRTLPQTPESRRLTPIERPQYVPTVQVPENVIVPEEHGVAVELVEDSVRNSSDDDDIGHLQSELEPTKKPKENPKEIETTDTTEDFMSVKVEGTMEVSVEGKREVKIEVSADVPEEMLESEKRMAANDVKNIVDGGDREYWVVSPFSSKKKHDKCTNHD